jgi:hypothetical protein
VRRDYLKNIAYPYRCRRCSPKHRPNFEERIRTSRAHRKHSLDESFFSEIDSEEKVYWLGFLCGDGTITGNRVRLELAVMDELHLNRFKAAVKWSGKNYYHKCGAVEVSFKSLKMVKDLACYHITPRKTYTVRFPDIPKSLERHFIRGVFDADGCMTKQIRITRRKSGRVYISHGGEFSIEGNRELVSAIQLRLVELGLSANSINYAGKNVNRVRYGGINQLKTIYRYLYDGATIYLERKKELFDNILENYHWEQQDTKKETGLGVELECGQARRVRAAD